MKFLYTKRELNEAVSERLAREEFERHVNRRLMDLDKAIFELEVEVDKLKADPDRFTKHE